MKRDNLTKQLGLMYRDDLLNLNIYFGLVGGASQKTNYLSRETLIDNLLHGKSQEDKIYPLPIPHQNLPRVSPFPKITCGDVLRCILKRPSTQNDRKEWREIVSTVVKGIKHFLDYKEDGFFYIPVNTILFHGSLNPDLNFFEGTKSHPFFFGIEESISIWYIYEAWLSNLRRKPLSEANGYLYSIRVTKPIPVTKIINKLIQHPNEEPDCWGVESGVCIHPQQIFHGTSDTFRDLGIEVTLRPEIFKDSLTVDTVPVPISIKDIHDLAETET